MKRPDFLFYPTLLDAFQRYLDTRAEDYFFLTEDGKWHKNYNEYEGTFVYSQDEVDELLLAELIAKINREEGIVTEAASKGTIFNEVVDCIIHHRPCSIDGATIASEPSPSPIIRTTIDGFEFLFDKSLCRNMAAHFPDAVSQLKVEATIDTCYGTVGLYGYVDELLRDRVYDIKTTKRYVFGNYSKYWQRHVYPYCLIESGACVDIKAFEFTIAELKGGTERSPLIVGDIYTEVYDYDHVKSTQLIRQQCERFCEFLHDHRKMITDTKIYNLP